MRRWSWMMLLAVAGCSTPSVGSYPEDENLALPDRRRAEDAGETETTATGSTVKPTLTVTITGTGTGTITSTPPGLTCTNKTCTGIFENQAVVTLSHTTAAGSQFVGWTGGGCTGAAACAPKLTADLAVGVEFASIAGTWTGTYTNTRPSNGCIFNNAGNLTVTIEPSGASFTTTASFTGLEIRQLGRGCPVQRIETGTASRSDLGVSDKLTGTWNAAIATVGSLAFPFSATITGKTMIGAWTCPNCVGSFTLTKQ